MASLDTDIEKLLPYHLVTAKRVASQPAPTLSPRRSKSFHVLPFILVVSIVLVASSLFSLFLLWHPQNMEDLLINQGFLPVHEQELTNVQFAQLGRNVMKHSSVNIYGVSRDIKHSLEVVLPQIDELTMQFHSANVVIVDGQSTDGSLEVLQAWAAKSPHNRKIVVQQTPAVEDSSMGPFAGQELPREGRISHARNLALDALKGMSADRSDPEYMIAIDLDVVGWNPLGVRDSFGRPSWDAICANGVILQGVFRDTYAFRTQQINTNHHLNGDDHLLYNISKAERVGNRRMVKESKARATRMMDTTPSGVESSVPRPISVESCFGGLAIYRTAAVGSCRYTYRHPAPQRMQDCEHVLFHQCMREENHARIFSNPHMKLWYGHSGIKDLKLKKPLSKVLPSFLLQFVP